ncbi:hypothetical protein P152DRAFT_429957 [Eremomyces bilateralis CBS 781.70]|uniref:Uncharacterized protein n=1 Tax=Eremomyces bilateralis CBS 781.70 TaxID=1392243 RepID=A0A6G1GCT5_9PEZI|nr:uncharacterized protein P152DRAFT_429957 [Eremomyces bilateralis CBS 781.70]KAF1815710.1 hypothetical protein P152DRAFT_429957 [Eremomyces bilateralis CBS 781.70]
MIDNDSVTVGVGRTGRRRVFVALGSVTGVSPGMYALLTDCREVKDPGLAKVVPVSIEIDWLAKKLVM